MDSESRENTGLPRRLRLLAMTKESRRFSRAHGRTVASDSLSKCHSHQVYFFGKLLLVEKFLINRSGEVIARFAPDIAADDPRLVSVIEAELARSA